MELAKTCPAPSSMECDVFRRAVHDLFLCRICHFLVFPHYTHCKNGHPLCNFCMLQEDKCPDCLAIQSSCFTDPIGLLTFPCYYKNFGCLESPPANKWHSHVYKCNFSPYKID